jgi:hypothetical protein
MNITFPFTWNFVSSIERENTALGNLACNPMPQFEVLLRTPQKFWNENLRAVISSRLPCTVLEMYALPYA